MSRGRLFGHMLHPGMPGLNSQLRVPTSSSHPCTLWEAAGDDDSRTWVSCHSHVTNTAEAAGSIPPAGEVLTEFRAADANWPNSSCCSSEYLENEPTTAVSLSLALYLALVLSLYIHLYLFAFPIRNE